MMCVTGGGGWGLERRCGVWEGVGLGEWEGDGLGEWVPGIKEKGLGKKAVEDSEGAVVEGWRISGSEDLGTPKLACWSGVEDGAMKI